MPETFQPTERLRSHVRTILVVDATSDQPRSLLPEAGLIVGFRFGGSASLAEGSLRLALPTAGVTGLRLSARRMIMSKGGGVVVVVLHPLGAARLFAVAPHELFGSIVGLADLARWPELPEVEERLSLAASNRDRAQIVDALLRRHLDSQAADPLVASAVTMIHQARGNVSIRGIAKQLGTSYDPLEKRFRRLVGASPKQFASIVRLRGAVESYRRGSSLSTIAHDAGYFDQSHFIRTFRSFTGEPPQRFLRDGKFC